MGKNEHRRGWIANISPGQWMRFLITVFFVGAAWATSNNNIKNNSDDIQELKDEFGADIQEIKKSVSDTNKKVDDTQNKIDDIYKILIQQNHNGH